MVATNPTGPTPDVLRATLTIAQAERWPAAEIQVLRRAIRESLNGQGLPLPEPASAFLEREYPPPTWLVENLIPSNTIGAIAGPSFSGKTLVAIHATALATQRGHRVTYVLEEGTAQDFKARLQAARVAPEFLQLMFQAGARIDSPEWVEHWKDVLSGQDIAFFDTFSDVTAVDQLDPKGMLAIFKAVRSIRIATGCTIVLLMHSPKAVFKGDTAPSLADVFGSVVAVNHMDFVHLIRTMKDDDEEVAGAVEVHCRKLRSAGSAPPGPRTGEIVEHELDGGTTVSFRFTEGVSPKEAKLVARTEKVRSQVLAYIAEHRVSSANAVVEGLGGKTQTVKQAVKDLLAIGRITHGPSGDFMVAPVPSVPSGSKVVPIFKGTEPSVASQVVPSGGPFRDPREPGNHLEFSGSKNDANGSSGSFSEEED